MNNTVTITDTLPEIINDAWDEILELLKGHFAEWPDDDCPSWNTLDHRGSLHEIIDSAVPIYNRELNELAYFHHREALIALEERFGSCDGEWPLGMFAAGLYCLIDEACRQMFDDEAEDLWREWQESKDL
jgi:hypothetical protein